MKMGGFKAGDRVVNNTINADNPTGEAKPGKVTRVQPPNKVEVEYDDGSKTDPNKTITNDNLIAEEPQASNGQANVQEGTAKAGNVKGMGTQRPKIDSHRATLQELHDELMDFSEGNKLQNTARRREWANRLKEIIGPNKG